MAKGAMGKTGRTAGGGAAGKAKMPSNAKGTAAGKSVKTGAKGKARSSGKAAPGKVAKGTGAASRMY